MAFHKRWLYPRFSKLKVTGVIPTVFSLFRFLEMIVQNLLALKPGSCKLFNLLNRISFNKASKWLKSPPIQNQSRDESH